MLARYIGVQRKFEALLTPLTAEEHRIQPTVEASPPWWSLLASAYHAENWMTALQQISN